MVAARAKTKATLTKERNEAVERAASFEQQFAQAQQQFRIEMQAVKEKADIVLNASKAQAQLLEIYQTEKYVLRKTYNWHLMTGWIFGMVTGLALMVLFPDNPLAVWLR